MASETEQEEAPYEFIIPNNFTDSGKLLQGMISTRNLIEAVAICGGLGLLEYGMLWTTAGEKITIIVMVITLAPLLLGCIIGINGDCFSIFMKSLIVFLKNKRKLRFRRIYVNGKEELQLNTKGRKSKKRSSKPAPGKK